jgi:hypothetical protein
MIEIIDRQAGANRYSFRTLSQLRRGNAPTQTCWFPFSKKGQI